MKCKIAICFAILMVICFQKTYSQQIGYREITEKRIEFIAPRLPLTSEESEKFWPLFREFHTERERLSKVGKVENRQPRQNPSTEKEYLEAVNQMIESKLQQVTLMKQYNDKYLKVLPASKVYQLYLLDEDFNKRLLNQLKDQDRERRK